MSSRLIELMERLPRSRVVVVGDLMIDRYVYGNAERLSPEAPVPVLHVQRERSAVGGAGNVAADLAVLGASVRMVGVVGQDEAATQIRREMEKFAVETDYLLTEPTRPTCTKVRLVGLAQHRHPQQMLRIDYEDATEIGGPVAGRLLDLVARALDGADALCIEDYNKGLLAAEVCRQIIRMARACKVPVFVDPAAISDYSKYHGASAITPNATETEKATGMSVRSLEQWKPAAEKLLHELDLEAAILTLDKNGAYVATRDGERKWLKTKERKVYDVTGAGDMVLAMITAARAGGASWMESVALANVAGGLEVERFGIVPITKQEIIQEVLMDAQEHMAKLRLLPELLNELEYHRAVGKKIVFTNGCFDLIHLGHVKYFQFAKAQGDLLVVAVNTDASISRLKSPKRPIVNQQDRIGVLEELESIDYLISFDSDTPLELIRQIKPDVLVKGADYKKEQVVGWDFVEGHGGRVALAPLINGRSTSNLVRRILEAEAADRRS